MLAKKEWMKTERLKGHRKEMKTGMFTEEGVNAVLLEDLLSSVSSPTIVLKMDIEGYECKVTSLHEQIIQFLVLEVFQTQFFVKVESG